MQDVLRKDDSNPGTSFPVTSRFPFSDASPKRIFSSEGKSTLNRTANLNCR